MIGGLAPISVVSVGARAATGATALEAAMWARARRSITRSTKLPGGRVVDTRPALGVAEGVQGFARLLAIAAPALREAHASPWTDPTRLGLDPARPGRDPLAAELAAPLPLLLALAAPGRPGDDERLAGPILDALAEQAGVPVDRERSRVFRAGHAAGAQAFEAALELLSSGGRHAAIVGGVDAVTHPELLSALQRDGRLGGAGGLRPGEGAAFLLLARGQPARPAGPLRRIATVLAAATGSTDAGAPEPSRDSRARPLEPGLGDAMSGLIGRAAALMAGVGVEWVMTDVDGTRARLDEWSEVRRRALAAAKHEHRLAETLGEVGAAIGPLLAAIACTWFEANCAPAASVLVTTASEGPERGAILLEASPDDREPRPPIADLRRTPAIAVLARATLEQVRELPAGERRRAACAELDFAWGALGELLRREDADPAQLEALEEAARRTAEARRVLEGVRGPAFARTARSLAAVEDALGRARAEVVERIVAAERAGAAPTATPARPAFRASVGRPSLHALPATGLCPFSALLTRGSAIDEPDDDDDDATDRGATPAPVSGAAKPARAASVAPEALRRLAREAMEEIGRLAWLRPLRPGQGWSPAAARFEQRMLDQLDALVALGHGGVDVAGEVLRYTTESLVDTGRAFTRAFVLGCLEGEEPVRAALMVLRDSHPASHDAQREALSLASSPILGRLLDEVCLDGDARIAALALDVLRARREARFSPTAILTAHPSPEVRRSAVRALGVVPEREQALAVLESMLGEDLDASVAAALAESLVGLDSPAGLELARQLLQGELGAPGGLAPEVRSALLRLVAIAGAPSDLDLVLRAAVLPVDLAIVGWLGHAGSIDLLLQRMGHQAGARAGEADWTTREAIGRALQRITGAVPDDPTRHLTAAPTGAAPSDARAWRAWWTAHGHALELRQKHRFGAPASVATCIAELEHEGVVAEVREACALELAARLGGAEAPWLDDWIPRLLERLGALRARAESRAGRKLHAPGQWIGQELGRRRP